MSAQEVCIIPEMSPDDLPAEQAIRNCIALTNEKNGGGRCKQPKTSATKNYIENDSDPIIFRELCTGHKKKYQKDPKSVKLSKYEPQVRVTSQSHGMGIFDLSGFFRCLLNKRTTTSS